MENTAQEQRGHTKGHTRGHTPSDTAGARQHHSLHPVGSGCCQHQGIRVEHSHCQHPGLFGKPPQPYRPQGAAAGLHHCCIASSVHKKRHRGQWKSPRATLLQALLGKEGCTEWHGGPGEGKKESLVDKGDTSHTDPNLTPPHRTAAVPGVDISLWKLFLPTAGGWNRMIFKPKPV